MKRRKVLGALAAAPLGVVAMGWTRLVTAADTKPARPLAEIQQNWQTLLAKGADVAQSTAPLQRTEAEWKQSLPEPQFAVLRKEATERPFSSALNDEKRAGVFVCAGCTLPLFTSQMKFDSGTGWPSFFTSIPGHLATKQDLQLILPRTEYHCTRCGGHQGHVFDDGPPPTGQRWCNNGLALKFIPTTGKA
jgi:peptide-methionine (R)-S-oxide reductase